MRNRARTAAFIGAALLGTNLASAVWAQSADSTAIEDGFSAPPPEARPRVWWHWLNGNVTEEGITKDIEWMSRIGIGGLQNFDAALFTPQIVPERKIYMTQPWRKAFRHAVEEADRHGLELAVAASPGWSETGGPWVTPADGMKKIVWSEREIAGGSDVVVKLAPPPIVSGPFQDVTATHVLAATNETPTYYADTAVLAYRIAANGRGAPPRFFDANGRSLDAAILGDRGLARALSIPHDPVTRLSHLTIEYDAPREIRSLILAVQGVSRSVVDTPDLKPVLDFETTGGEWRKIADIPLDGAAQTTIAFEPVVAKRFRIQFVGSKPQTTVDRIGSAPGAVTDSYRAPKAPRETVEITELRLSGEPRIHMAEVKAGFGLVPDYYALDATASREPQGIAAREIVDLTGKMASDGTLRWKAPKGQWRILRFGYSLTGTVNHPATPEATGLEVDKYDGQAVDRYIQTYLSRFAEVTGPDLIGERGLRALLTDSIEAGPSNWTPRIEADFKRLRGYELRPWLPALTGAVIGSRESTDAFLYDYRRTLADLLVTEHYGVIAKAAHDRGMKVYGEALELGRPSLGDDMAMRKFADVPMAAFWTYSDRGGRRPVFLADMKGAASAANVYGKKYVAAESLTSGFAPWAFSPAQLKPFIDMEFVHGINRPIIHTSVHQPLDDKKPGLSLLIFGQHFTRHETWAEMAKPWVSYISRSSYLLQRGRNLADVGYFYGEEAPLTGLYKSEPVADAPTRNQFDFVNPDALHNAMRFEDGAFQTSGGARYRLLYLGGSSERMTVATLRKLLGFAEAGGAIAGRPPVRSPALHDDPKEFAALVDRLWPSGTGGEVGNGRSILAATADEAVAKLNIAPDFEMDAAPKGELLFLHRTAPGEDIYFLTNRAAGPLKGEARFRVTGREPEIFRADDGSVSPASYRTDGDHTVVPLEMAAGEAFFVVFRKKAADAERVIAKQDATALVGVTGPWRVEFEPGRGAPPTLKLDTLVSLADSEVPGIRYFSGVATYRNVIDLPKRLPKGRILLDLGDIGDVAEVFVGGKSAGIAWKAPYLLDVTSMVKAGRNAVEIRVANLWVNRLVGDAQPDAEKVTFTTLATYRADAPLRKSGLIGPVRILVQPERGRK